MNKSNDNHEAAMNIAEQAFLARLSGSAEIAVDLYSSAFEYEQRSAMQLGIDDEPSRSILFRSAASLALNARKFREAEKMVAYGLSGNPPEEIADELRDIYEQVTFERHLKLKNILLSENEFQMALAGPEAGYGYIHVNEFLDRITIIEKMAHRTAERKLNRPFRTRGKISKQIKESYDPYVSAGRAASYAVTFRLGQRVKNFPLFDEDPTQSVINDIVNNIKLINDGDIGELERRINNEDYYTNFIALVKKIAPDGEKVNLVGFTATINGKEQNVSLLRLNKDIRIPLPPQEGDESDLEYLRIDGKVTFADANESDFKITDQNGLEYKIIVPKGVLVDIVKPFWESYVTVSCKRINKKYYFDDIEGAK